MYYCLPNQQWVTHQLYHLSTPIEKAPLRIKHHQRETGPRTLDDKVIYSYQ